MGRRSKQLMVVVVALISIPAARSSSAAADPASWPGQDLSRATLAFEKPQRPLFSTRLAEAKPTEEHRVGKITIAGVTFALSGLQCPASKDPYANTWYTIQLPRYGTTLVSIETERNLLSVYLKDGRIYSTDIPASWRAGELSGELYNQYDLLEVVGATVRARLGQSFVRRYNQATKASDKQALAKMKPAYDKVVTAVFSQSRSGP